jgi:hypothetical protein
VDDDVRFARLRSAIQLEQLTLSAEHRAAVMEQVCAVVDVLQRAGWLVETIIVQIKHASASFAPARGLDELIAEAVSLCIQHYYRDVPPLHRSVYAHRLSL